MSHDALRRGARACAGWSTAASWPAAGATRPARAGSATSSAGSPRTSVPAAYAEAAQAAGVSVHEHLTGLAAEQAVGEHGLVALDWHSGNRSVLVDHELSGAGRRADPGHQARGRLPGAARGDGVRHPRDRRDLPRQRGAGRGVRGRRRAGQERAADADLRRRDPAAALGHRLRAGPRARVGHPRGGGRGRLPRRTDRGEVHGQGAQGRLPPRRGAGRRSTTRCSSSTSRCTTTSAGPPRRCAGSRPSAGLPSLPGR